MIKSRGMENKAIGGSKETKDADDKKAAPKPKSGGKSGGGRKC